METLAGGTNGVENLRGRCSACELRTSSAVRALLRTAQSRYRGSPARERWLLERKSGDGELKKTKTFAREQFPAYCARVLCF